jgi:hypothetical protein
VSRLRVRVAAPWVVAAVLSAGAAAGAAPAGGVADLWAAEAAPIVPLSPPPADALPAPIPDPSGPAPVPLPPGVFVGLVGLASAAIARRRYLKRH